MKNEKGVMKEEGNSFKNNSKVSNNKNNKENNENAISEEEYKNKQMILKETIKQLNSKKDSGVLIYGREDTKPWPSLSTGSVSLDFATGIGGVPKGRIVEIYGYESSGKTTLALSIIAQAQKRRGNCIFIDVENAFNEQHAEKIGVKLKDLIICQPNCGEQALEWVETFIASESVDVIVVDSVSALTPKAELEGNMEDVMMGGQARLMSKALRKIITQLIKKSTIVIFINQIRLKIGVMFGNPETTSGGTALKFYASMRLEVKRLSLIKDKDNIVGQEVQVRICKNKLSFPGKVVNFQLLYAQGINTMGEIVDLSLYHGIIKKNGSWFFYHDQKIAQGKEGAMQELAKNNELYQTIYNELKKAMPAFNDGSTLKLDEVQDHGPEIDIDLEEEEELKSAQA
jgi:recombination protein RecA